MPRLRDETRPSVAGTGRLLRFVDPSAIFLLALCVQFVPSLRSDGNRWNLDEAYSVATITHILKTGNIPVHKLGQSYMFPMEELTALPFTTLTDSAWGFRLSGLLLWSCGCSFLFLALRREYSRTVCWSVCLLFAVTNPMIQIYTTQAIGEYSAAFCLLNLFWYLAQPRLQQESIGTNLLLGLLAAVGVLAFRLLLFYVIAWFVLKLRERWRQRSHQNSISPKALAGLTLQFCLLGGLLFPSVYRYLTRVSSSGFLDQPAAGYTPKNYEFLLWGLAAGIALSIAITLYRFRQLVSPRWVIESIVSIAPVGIVMILPPLYSRMEMARIYPADDQPVLWNVNYSWRHYHEWWGNVCTLFGDVFPQLLLENGSIEIENYSHSWTLFGTVFLLSVLAPFCRGWRHIADTLNHKNSCVFYLIALIICLLFLTPSWRLYGKPSSRYLLLFLPGLLLWWTILFTGSRRKAPEYLLLALSLLSCTNALWAMSQNVPRVTAVTPAEPLAEIAENHSPVLILVQTRSEKPHLNDLVMISQLQWALRRQPIEVLHVNDLVTNIGYPHKQLIEDSQSMLIVKPVGSIQSSRLTSILSETNLAERRFFSVAPYEVRLLNNSSADRDATDSSN